MEPYSKLRAYCIHLAWPTKLGNFEATVRKGKIHISTGMCIFFTSSKILSPIACLSHTTLAHRFPFSMSFITNCITQLGSCFDIKTLRRDKLGTFCVVVGVDSLVAHISGGKIRGVSEAG